MEIKRPIPYHLQSFAETFVRQIVSSDPPLEQKVARAREKMTVLGAVPQ